MAKEDFEGNQSGWGIFTRGLEAWADPYTRIQTLNVPYTQRAWKNAHNPFASGALAGKAPDDVIIDPSRPQGWRE